MRRLAVAALAAACCAAAPVPARAVDGLRVRLEATRGWPRDSVERAVFDSAFSAVLLGTFPPGTDRGSLVFDTTSHPDSVWHLEVVIGLPAELPGRRTRVVRSPGSRKARREVLLAERGARANRGLTVVVRVTSPQAMAAGAGPTAVRAGVMFPGGQRDPYPFAEAGAATGTLTLEALFHMVDPAAPPFDLSPAVRVDSRR